MKEYTFKGLAYLKSARLDQQGCESITFQFDASQQVEIAKLKLMARNLISLDAMLLEVVVRVEKGNLTKTLQNKRVTTPKTKHTISRRTVDS